MTPDDRLGALLVRSGGVCRSRRAAEVAGREAVRRALADGRLVRPARGWVALPLADEARLAAAAVSGTVIGLSAALDHGWAVKVLPPRPTLAVDPRRHLGRDRTSRYAVRWRALPSSDVTDGVTTPERTVLDCALDLPFDEALAVADSALRAGVALGGLRARVAAMGRVRRQRVLRVLDAADADAANPFESVLRAIALGVPGLTVRTQVQVRGGFGRWHYSARCDLGDRSLRLVIEADSHEFHSSRRQLTRDCARYDNLVADGWTVLRFSWEQVMFEPEWVRAVIERTVQRLRAAPHRQEDPSRRIA